MSLWKLILLILVLAVFAYVGILHAVNPDRYLQGAHRAGGELLKGFIRIQIRVVGAVFAAFALYMIYSLLTQS